jgi:GR25 family glycosyltransferase involved in LPS biosynthesis
MVYHQLQHFEHGGTNGKMLDLRLYGMLSSFIAKFEMFVKQVTEKIPWSVIIEDDIVLCKSFQGFICNLTERFELDSTLNMIRLGTWAEGYMTSFESAKNILRCLCRMGVYQNIDNQLRDLCGPDLYIQPPLSSWNILIEANEGHTKKTRFVNETMLRAIIPNKNSTCSKLRQDLSQPFFSKKKKVVECMLNKVKSEMTGDCVQKPWYDFKSCTDEIRTDKQTCLMHEWMLSHCHLSCCNHSLNADRKGC